MEINYKELGQRIKIARIKKGLTQDKVSERTGLSHPHISNIETGSTKVGLPSLVRIANVLDVSVDSLLCDTLTHAKDVFENEIVKEAKDCNDVEVKIIADTVKSLKTTLRNRLSTNEKGAE